MMRRLVDSARLVITQLCQLCDFAGLVIGDHVVIHAVEAPAVNGTGDCVVPAVDSRGLSGQLFAIISFCRRNGSLPPKPSVPQRVVIRSMYVDSTEAVPY